MNPFFILADDLTGAADSAARCHSAGLSARIYLRPPTPPFSSAVIAFTSDSRHLSPAQAAQRVRTVAASLCHEQAHWYKKIDSTLRGNMGSEIDALLDLLHLPCAVISPAFPAQGRGLRDGALIASSLSTSGPHLPHLLRQQSQRQVTAFSLADLWAAQAPELFTAAVASGTQLLVCDAMRDEDLDRLVDVVETALPAVLFCGSAGLIGTLARRAGGSFPSPSSGNQDEAAVRTLVVMGSGSPIAHQQVAKLQQERTIFRTSVVQDKPDTLVARCVAANQEVTVLHLPPPDVDLPLDGTQARHWAEHLAETAVAVMAELHPQRLILTGGDTAVSVLSRLGIEALTVLAELLPGMPLCQGKAANGQTYQVIMKPGSFGDEETLVALLQ